jgi:rare lipoprotein A
VKWPLCARILGAALVAVLLSACGGKKQARVNPPPPPPLAAPPATSAPAAPSYSTPTRAEVTPQSSADKKQEKADEIARELSVPEGTKPLAVETGNASWYGAPYHNRRSSNGEIYDMNQLTAAHRTLPLGSTVRVTNLKTGHSTVVRITDRGPFVEGRIVDLSLAAAKQADIWQAGVAKVRLEVLRTPVAFDHGGRWAVQIGSFAAEDGARTLANRLFRRYKTAKVLSFGSPAGDWWVRVRVLQDDRKRAEEVVRDTQTSEGKIFLVRLD